MKQGLILLISALALISSSNARSRPSACQSEDGNEGLSRLPLNFGNIPDSIMELARELNASETSEERNRTEYDAEENNFADLASRNASDPSRPSIALPNVEDELRRILSSPRGTWGRATRALHLALNATVDARVAFSRGSRENLSHLCRTIEGMKKALGGMDQARNFFRYTTDFPPKIPTRIEGLQKSLTNAARKMAEGMFDRAEKAGVDRDVLIAVRQEINQGLAALRLGRYTVAAGHFGGALDFASNSLVFDVDLFEQNIHEALDGNTVGYALTIAWKGQLFDHVKQFDGKARTADLEELDQSPIKEMHVVSVSKTITTIVLLRLLEENGETPDSVVAPFLPSYWTFNDGSDTLTFKDFLQHKSNFGQNSVGNTYAQLRSAFQNYNGGLTDCGDTFVGAKNFCYNNGNFGLMRVVIAKLLGFDMTDFLALPGFPASISTALFLSYSLNLYNSIAVSVNCQSQDDEPTIQYNLPGNTPGYEEPDRRSECGGIGWHVSSNELAAIMAYLRLTNGVLLSEQARDWMEEGYLGYMDPANYGWIDDTFGPPHMHGGDWFHSSGEAHACALAFPIQVQVGLVINSERAAIMPYQCLLVQQAFEDAWVKP